MEYRRIQEWFERCDRLHSPRYSSSKLPQTVPLRCIDCKTRKIIQVGLHEKYIALSYVWGTSNANESRLRSIARALPMTGVPQVIEDALVVFNAPGMQYLWVDKYCIDQHDHNSRSLQIRNMDRIYEGAYATIVACAGLNACFGLPGVGRVARKC